MKTDDGRGTLRSMPKKDMACQQVIDQLKKLIKLAEEGDIKNMFAICELRAEDPMFVQAGPSDPLKTLGLLEWASARWRETQIMDYESDLGPDTS